jgi:hypothetical protein
MTVPIFKLTRHHIPDFNLHKCCCENHKLTTFCFLLILHEENGWLHLQASVLEQLRKLIFQRTDYTSIFSNRRKTRTSWKLTSPSFQQTGCACHLAKLAQTEPRVMENYKPGFLKSTFRNNWYSQKQIQ